MFTSSLHYILAYNFLCFIPRCSPHSSNLIFFYIFFLSLSIRIIVLSLHILFLSIKFFNPMFYLFYHLFIIGALLLFPYGNHLLSSFLFSFSQSHTSFFPITVHVPYLSTPHNWLYVLHDSILVHPPMNWITQYKAALVSSVCMDRAPSDGPSISIILIGRHCKTQMRTECIYSIVLWWVCVLTVCHLLCHKSVYV